jgi:hypothetical protein
MRMSRHCTLLLPTPEALSGRFDQLDNTRVPRRAPGSDAVSIGLGAVTFGRSNHAADKPDEMGWTVPIAPHRSTKFDSSLPWAHR